MRPRRQTGGRRLAPSQSAKSTAQEAAEAASTFGDDSRNFLAVPAGIARANHRRVNEVIARLAERHGRLVDLHAHFLRGEPPWFTRTIEPGLAGASEVRRAFLDAVCPACSR